jgi:hypothetical protein
MRATSRWSLVATGLASAAVAMLAVAGAAGSAVDTRDTTNGPITCCSV